MPYCIHGCYPVDCNFYFEKGFNVEKFIDSLDADKEIKAEARSKIRKMGLKQVSDIVSFRNMVDALKKIIGTDVGEKALVYMKKNLDYKGDLGEPYVGVYPTRTLVMCTSVQGKPMESYRFLVDVLDYYYGYKRHLVKEWLNVGAQSQYFQEMSQRRQQAEQNLVRILANISDLYKEKHLLEHDIRKLKERVRSFDIAERQKEKAEREKDAKKKSKEKIALNGEEELKADYIDLVDIHTGRRSIEQMVVNNVFPTLMADFYRMTSEDDLKKGGILETLPESEKAILRKKWKLYLLWKEEFGKVVRQKLADIERRYNSILTSIEQTEKWIEPYIRTIKTVHTSGEALDQVTNPYLIEGYSTSWRDLKLVCYKVVRNVNGDPTHYDVVVIDITHITYSGTEQPQLAGAGGEVVQYDFKEFMVCKHVFDAAFKVQIDEKKNEIKEYIKMYTGEAPLMDTDYDTDNAANTIKGKGKGKEKGKKFEQETEQKEKASHFKNKILRFFGKGDKYFVPYDDLPGLRKKLVGPHHKTPLYLTFKYENKMFVMD